MKKIYVFPYVLLCIFLILLSSYVSGESTLSDISHAWPLNSTNETDWVSTLELVDQGFNANEAFGINPPGVLNKYIDATNDFYKSVNRDLPQNITVSFWINVTSNIGSETMFKYDTFSGDNDYWRFASSSDNYFQLFAPPSITCNKSISLNTWHNVVFFRNRTASKIWMDGTLCNVSSHAAQETGTNLGPIDIGSSGNDGPYILDEIYLWYRELTPIEITSLYRGGDGFFYPFNHDIDNCSDYTTKIFNFTLADETNESVLNGDIEYFFSTINITYTGSETNINASDFCAVGYPFDTNLTLSYSSTNYDSRTYILNNYEIDNITDTIKLYLLPTTDATDITLHVVDDSDADQEGILIEAYRWNIPTDSDILVETEYTDSDGNAIFSLEEQNVYYSFKFYQNGVLKLTTSRFKIFSTTLEYVLITTETTILEEYLDMQTITSSLTYSNTTRLITFDFTDPGSVANNFCLNITDTNGTGITSNCSSNPDNLSYTIPYNNQSYVILAMARNSDSGRYYVLETLGVRGMNTFRDWVGSDNALTLGLIIFLTISLLALVNKNIAIAGSVFSVIILYFLGILGDKIILMGLIGIAILGIIIMNKRSTT